MFSTYFSNVFGRKILNSGKTGHFTQNQVLTKLILVTIDKRHFHSGVARRFFLGKPNMLNQHC